MELDALLSLAALLLFVGAIAIVALNTRPAGAKVAMALFVLAAICVVSYANLTTESSLTECGDACLVGTMPETEGAVLSGLESD